jgi:GNAT superfamily N-acetyltransferase
MIRRRRASLDDRTIHRMIIKELMPYTLRSFPKVTLPLSKASERLSHGITKVAVTSMLRKPYGFITYFVKDNKLFIDMLAVHSLHQGKGIGQQLLNDAFAYGQQKGCDKAMVYVDKLNEGAQRFYVRNGYRFVKLDTAIQCYLLEKDLV